MNIYPLCIKHYDDTIWDLSTCVCDCFWDAHESFIYSILFLKFGCDNMASTFINFVIDGIPFFLGVSLLCSKQHFCVPIVIHKNTKLEIKGLWITKNQSEKSDR